MKTPATTTMTMTNTRNHELAEYLEGATGKTTFSAVIYTKVGKQAGRGAAKKFYGRDTVMDTIVTGFSYMGLVRKDLATIGKITAEELQAACKVANAVDKAGALPDLEACSKALDDQAASCRRTLDGTNVSTTDDVRQPLVVNGETIPGCWVNDGSVDPKKTGIPYLYGLRVGRKVIERDENGPIPQAKSAAHVVAKKILKSQFLRVGRWCQVRLEGDYVLKIGGSAAVMANEYGVDTFDDVTVRE